MTFDPHAVAAKAMATDLPSRDRRRNPVYNRGVLTPDAADNWWRGNPEPPLSDEHEARGDWEDAVAERVDTYDPDDYEDRPHPGGARWERLTAGEAWRG